MFKLGDVREGQVELRGRGWRSEKGWGRSNGETVVRQTNEENEPASSQFKLVEGEIASLFILKLDQAGEKHLIRDSIRCDRTSDTVRSLRSCGRRMRWFGDRVQRFDQKMDL